ncbi:SRPBCC domain-containing protein [Sinomonas sp. ASV322]|uniref:SRPBCC domain-containing protein n=1 Tax=Sinomonas sp. ASV322 TaxID=3041920 RepID=UPI0027DD55E1|nr:SRPBCC domain-containing protein [Sinomonas sp. ASV322]MDQ4503982.1 hypothetical protein [Sinomonas sp. ASV322]
MEPLFSHRPDSGESDAAAAAPPSRLYRLTLPAPRDIAFSAFVGDIHLWWPTNYTGFGEGTHAFVEGGIIGEESALGEMQAWGEVVEETPGEAIEFAWTLAWRPDAPTRVRAEFGDAGSAGGVPSTLMTFTQDGWAQGHEGFEQYEKYSEWPVILGRFAAYFGVPEGSVETVA